LAAAPGGVDRFFFEADLAQQSRPASDTSGSAGPSPTADAAAHGSAAFGDSHFPPTPQQLRRSGRHGAKSKGGTAPAALLSALAFCRNADT